MILFVILISFPQINFILMFICYIATPFFFLSFPKISLFNDISISIRRYQINIFLVMLLNFKKTSRHAYFIWINKMSTPNVTLKVLHISRGQIRQFSKMKGSCRWYALYKCWWCYWCVRHFLILRQKRYCIKILHSQYDIIDGISILVYYDQFYILLPDISKYQLLYQREEI